METTVEIKVIEDQMGIKIAIGANNRNKQNKCYELKINPKELTDISKVAQKIRVFADFIYQQEETREYEELRKI